VTGSPEEGSLVNGQFDALAELSGSAPRMAILAEKSFIAAGIQLQLTVSDLVDSRAKSTLTCSFSVGATGFEPVTSAL
jgi:hypothetical protein